MLHQNDHGSKNEIEKCFPSNLQIVELAFQIYKEWHVLGYSLELSKLELDEIEENSYNDVERAVKVLRQWKAGYRQQDSKSPWGNLARALEVMGKKELADQIKNGTIPSFDEKMTRLRTELQTVYNHLSCMVPLFQGNATPQYLEVEKVYTNIKLLHNVSNPYEEPKQSLDSLNHILESTKKRTLLRGRAGSGKSTMIRKLTKEWASGESNMSRFSLLFLLPMRYTHCFKTLGQAVVACLLSKDTHFTAADIDEIVRKHEADIAIFLDGYDEFLGADASSCRNVSAKLDDYADSLNISDIICFEELRRSWCVVTTRLWSVADFKEKVKAYMSYEQLEVAGFSPSNVESYVLEKCFKDDIEKGKSLLGYIESNNFMEGLASIPLILDLLCRLWQTSSNIQEKPPETLSMLFNMMLKCLYRHDGGKDCLSPTKKEQFFRNDSIDEKTFTEMIVKFGQIGYKGLMMKKKQKVVFHMREVKKLLKDQLHLIDCGKRVGLVKLEHVLGFDFSSLSPSCGESDDEWEDNQSAVCKSSASLSLLNDVEERHMSFYHIHIQEKCAGAFLHNLNIANPKSFQKKLGEIDSIEKALNMRYVLLFACGHQFGFPQRNRSGVSQSILRKLLDLHKKFLDPKGEVTITEKLKAVSGKKKAVTSNRRAAPNEKIITKKAHGSPNPLRQSFIFQQFVELCLHCYYESQAGSALNHEMGSLFASGCLHLVNVSGYTKRAFEYFLINSCAEYANDEKMEEVPLSSLHLVDLKFKFSMTYLRKFFSLFPSAEAIYLERMQMYSAYDDKYLQKLEQDLGEDLPYKPTFTSDFDLTQQIALLSVCQLLREWQPSRTFTSESVVSLLIYVPPHLQHLTLNVSYLNVDDFFQTCQRRCFEDLETLDLNSCSLSLYETDVIAMGLFHMPKLTSLSLVGNECGPKLVQALRKLKQLEVLNLEKTWMSAVVMRVLAVSLLDMRNLKHLDLRRSKMDDVCVEEILRSVLQQKEFEVLKLSLTDVSKNAITGIVGTIKDMKKLKVLNLNHCQYPSTLLQHCSSLPSHLPKLEDFRLSGLSPDASSPTLPPSKLYNVSVEMTSVDIRPANGIYKLERIRLADGLMKSFIKNLKSLKRLKVLCFLHMQLDLANFVTICIMCKELAQNKSLKLFRYSKAAVPPTLNLEDDFELARVLRLF